MFPTVSEEGSVGVYRVPRDQSSVVLGLDLGTTSISCVALSGDGQQLVVLSEPHRAEIAGLAAGRREQNPAIIRTAAWRLLKKLTDGLPRNSHVIGIGVTGQMHGTILLDAEYQPMSYLITWQDQRAVQALPDGSSSFRNLQKRISPEWQTGTGCRISPGYLGTTVNCLQETGEWPDACRIVCTIADWVVSQLRQAAPCTDRSNAASTGLYDLKQDTWQTDLLNATRTKAAWLPPVKASGCVLGTMSDDVADITGLPTSAFVCNAIGDHQAAVLSALPDVGSNLLINIGTGGQIAWRIPNFRTVEGMDTRYLPSLSANPGGPSHSFMLVGAGLVGGEALAWVNRTIGTWLSAFGVELSEEQIWERLHEQLQNSPDTDSPLKCEPYFSGTRPAPQRRAVFSNVSSTNFTPASVARSVYSGIAASMREFLNIAGPAAPRPIEQICLSGNGARRNPFLQAAFQKQFSVPVTVCGFREEAATGAALLALRNLP
ncbi:MAG: FGGY family carbohydrate kinase [Planctomycetaceae bacterium]